jgi:hypothetical protein
MPSSSPLETSIFLLEQANNPEEAFFSFTVDDTGEYGVIKANKEGLRLYAAELLKKSLLLEKEQEKENQLLFFDPKEWIVSDAGYDLIAGVLPEYHTRRQIMQWSSARQASITGRNAARKKRSLVSRSTVSIALTFFLMGMLILFAAFKAFPTLHLWVNIH